MGSEMCIRDREANDVVKLRRVRWCGGSGVHSGGHERCASPGRQWLGRRHDTLRQTSQQDSTFTITSRTGATTLLTPMAHSTQQAGCSRPTACQASRRVARMQVSAVSQQQHACMSTAGVVAHCAAVPHRCPSAGDGVHPALPEHVGSDCSATRGSFQAGVSTPHAGKRGLHGQRDQRERREHARRASVPSFY